MYDFFMRNVGKKVWRFGENETLLTDKVYEIVSVREKTSQWNTKYSVYVLRYGEELVEVVPNECVFVADDSLSEEDKVARYLSDNEIFTEEVYFPNDENELHATIYGDWKHSHKRADWLMEQIGYAFVNEIQVEDSEEDYYGAIHIYRKENNE